MPKICSRSHRRQYRSYHQRSRHMVVCYVSDRKSHVVDRRVIVDGTPQVPRPQMSAAAEVLLPTGTRCWIWSNRWINILEAPWIELMLVNPLPFVPSAAWEMDMFSIWWNGVAIQLPHRRRTEAETKHLAYIACVLSWLNIFFIFFTFFIHLLCKPKVCCHFVRPIFCFVNRLKKKPLPK